jgi:predicted  nucleic acid-binding Zn-ribbon protein
MSDILKVDRSASPLRVVTLVPLLSRRSTRRWVLLTLAALLAALLVACGESEEETAQDRVCDARADIQKRVDDLAALTITTASIDDVTSNLEAIRDDLQTIAAEREDLSPQQREQVDQAAKSFRSELETAAKDVVSGAASGEEAGARVGSALDQLAQSFREAYGPVDCD